MANERLVITSQLEREVIEMYLECENQAVVARNLDMARTTVRKILDRHGVSIVKEDDEYSEVTLSQSIVNAWDEKMGRTNPLQAARTLMSKDFTFFRGMECYKGKPINGMKDWDNIIQDLNRMRVAEGAAQLDYKDSWLVPEEECQSPTAQPKQLF